VDAFSVPGIELWFNSSDHLPPHFHASRRGAWEIRVFFLLCTETHLEWSLKWKDRRRTVARRALRKLRAKAVQCRAELIAEWEAKVEPR
jgi:Domain of unknown function (DUF4160)